VAAVMACWPHSLRAYCCREVVMLIGLRALSAAAHTFDYLNQASPSSRSKVQLRASNLSNTVTVLACCLSMYAVCNYQYVMVVNTSELVPCKQAQAEPPIVLTSNGNFVHITWPLLTHKLPMFMQPHGPTVHLLDAHHAHHSPRHPPHFHQPNG